MQYPYVFLLLLLGTLAGCAVFQETPTSAPTVAQQTLYGLHFWRLEGRIAVQTRDDAWQANLFWEHDPDQDRLRVSGPLSQGMVSIIVQKDLIYINEGNGVSRLSHDPDAELQARLGFAVPLRSLRYWVLGLPDRESDFRPVVTADSGPGGFEQAGWLLRYEVYTRLDGRVLPKKVTIRGAGVRLKLIADRWEIKG